ncbi:MAG: permease [Myxococcota bacterium]|nr:permease [Myxococcota bacterium]
MSDPHLALLLAIGALGLGPLLALTLERRDSLRALLDGFVLVMVGGLSLLFLLPDAYEGLGLWAFPTALLGLVLPTFGERLLRSSHAAASGLVLSGAVAGLLFHCAIDGAALALAAGPRQAGAASSGPLEVTLAIVAHRLPVGLVVWSVLSPAAGRRWALAGLAGLMAVTTLGFALSPQLLAALGEGALAPALVEALLAGGLLHVVVDHGPQCDDAQAHKGPAGLGALLAVGLLWLLPLEPLPVLAQSWEAGRRLFAETSPAILIGCLGAGLLSLVPQSTLSRWMRGKTTLGSAVRGVVFGLPIPICSCGVVPLYRGLMKKGLPPAAAVAFLIATPELGLDAVAISIPLLGWELTLLRVAAATLLALCAGLAVGALVRSPTAPLAEAEPPPSEPGGSRVERVWRYGFVESLDELGPWILAGIAVAAVLEPLLDPAWIAAVPPAAEIPLFASLAAPFYVCASAATPVGAAFLAKGVTAGAVIAFLLVGPATNVTTYGAVRAFHDLGTTLRVGTVILVVTLLLGVGVNGMAGSTVLAASEAHAHEPAAVGQLAALAFAALLAASLLRQGPRGFLARLGIRGHGHADHAGGHDPSSPDPCHEDDTSCAPAGT